MKKAKRILAFALCLLMLNSNVISTTAFATVSGNDVVVETTISTLITETTTETTTQTTTEPTTTPTEADVATGCIECGQIEGHLDTCSQYVAPAGCTECTQTEGHEETCSQYVDSASTTAEQLLAAESVEKMYAMVLDLMQNSPEALNALTAEEITDLRIRINELDPEGDDADTQDLLDTLTVLPNGGEELEGDPVMLPTEVISNSETWAGNVTLSADTTWKFTNGAVVTLKAPITIPNGKTLTLNGWGGFARNSDNTNQLFIVNEGGKLIIEGTSKDQPITIDGKDVVATTSLITSFGVLSFENAVIQNGKNRLTGSGYGGGITIRPTGSMTMENCTVTKNTATVFGGGIYCLGDMVISNSVISYNVAATGTDV